MCPDDEALSIIEAELRRSILSLSDEEKHFLIPEPYPNFSFDLERYQPLAVAALKADKQLGKMRYKLVPAAVHEETFWRNYFYKVHMLRHHLLTRSRQHLQENHGYAIVMPLVARVHAEQMLPQRRRFLECLCS